MHYLMFVTLTMLPGETSLDARLRVQDLLLEEHSFCGEGGRFGSPLCDWFVIGGRWSGKLQMALLGDAYHAAISQLADQHRDALNQFWHRFGGTGEHPHNRSGDHLGCDDDAMIVDQALYDRFLAGDPGRSCQTFADLDDEPMDETFIGRKWLVVVDYHNYPERNHTMKSNVNVIKYIGEIGVDAGLVDKLAQGDIAFGSNSWRGDRFEQPLRKAIRISSTPSERS